jgi:hypothetical protein
VFNHLRPLARIFARATETDGDLQTAKGILRLAKILVGSSGKPVRQIRFPATFELDGAVTQVGQQMVTTGLGSYVSATPEQIHAVVEDFMHPGPAKKIRAKPDTKRDRRSRSSSRNTTLKDALTTGRDLVAAVPSRRATKMRVYVPAQITQKGNYPASTDIAPNPRRYVIKDEDGNPHAAYRLTVVEDETKGQYYGVQGTTWRDPPILAAAHQTKRIGDRTFSLYTDGGKLRMVAWQTPKAAYWVSNTLSLDLTNREMLDIAASLTRARPSR